MLEVLFASVIVVLVFFLIFMPSVNWRRKELFVTRNLMVFSKFIKSFSKIIISLIFGGQFKLFKQ